MYISTCIVHLAPLGTHITHVQDISNERKPSRLDVERIQIIKAMRQTQTEAETSQRRKLWDACGARRRRDSDRFRNAVVSISSQIVCDLPVLLTFASTASLVRRPRLSTRADRGVVRRGRAIRRHSQLSSSGDGYGRRSWRMTKSWRGMLRRGVENEEGEKIGMDRESVVVCVGLRRNGETLGARPSWSSLRDKAYFIIFLTSLIGYISDDGADECLMFPADRQTAAPTQLPVHTMI